MPLIRSLVLARRTLFAVFISLNKEIISPCSRYIKKGLVYIAIIFLFSCQTFLYLEYTKTNTYLLYNVYLVSFNKCIFLCCYIYLYAYCSLLIP